MTKPGSRAVPDYGNLMKALLYDWEPDSDSTVWLRVTLVSCNFGMTSNRVSP